MTRPFSRFPSDRIADYFTEVSRGRVPGQYAVNKFGRATNVDSGVKTDIWDYSNATQDQPIWLPPTVATGAQKHDIVSTSGSDDGDPGGVGARTVRVYGLTSWSAKETSEDIILNGVGAVSTVNSYVIIHRMVVLTKGATDVNVGIIKATAATDATVTAAILAGQGQTQMAILGIPSTQTAYMNGLYVTFNKPGVAATIVAVNIELLYNPEPGVEELRFLTKHTGGQITAGTSGFSQQFKPPKKFVGPGIIKIQAIGGAADLDVSAGFDLVLIDN